MSNKSIIRNSGVDLLRIMSMIFVVLLHNLLEGGVLKHLSIGTPAWWMGFLLEDLAIVAVNLFALITGYLTIAHRVKSVRVLDVLFQTFFWSALIGVLLFCFGFPISTKHLLSEIIPIKHYWYIRAYLGFVLLAPLLQVGFDRLSKTVVQRIIFTITVISVSLGWIFDQFFLIQGYSAYWLLVMFLIGAYCHEYGLKSSFSEKSCLGMYFLMALITLVIQYVLWNGMNHLDLTISYNSPFVVVESVCLFWWGINLKINSNPTRVILAYLAKYSFGVYLIDASGFFRYILPNAFGSLANVHPLGSVAAAVFASLILYITFTLMDIIRSKVFVLFRYNYFIARLDEQLKNVLDRLIGVITE